MESFSCFVSLTASCPFSTQIGPRLWFQHLPVKCWLHWVAQLFDLQSGCSVKYDSPGLPFSEHSLSSPFPFMAEMAAYSLHVWLRERVLHGSHTCRCRSWGCVPAVVSAPVRTDSSRHSGANLARPALGLGRLCLPPWSSVPGMEWQEGNREKTCPL